MCYIRSDISYVEKDFFPNVIENIFFEILLPKTSLITVGIMYRPPSQTNFLEILNMTFEKVDVDKKEIYILGDFNINMYHNNRYIVRDDNKISSKFLSHDIKNYHQFCTMHGLKQLIQSPTCVTCNTSTLIGHTLTSVPSRVSQKGVINVGVSDHQLIFCTRTISKIKIGGDHKYLNFNLSVSQGVFPSACKVVKLKPIFKKGKKTDSSNYRHCFHQFRRSLKW